MKTSPIFNDPNLFIYEGRHVIINGRSDFPHVRDDGTPARVGDIHVDEDDATVYMAHQDHEDGKKISWSIAEQWLKTYPSFLNALYGINRHLARRVQERHKL